MRGQQKDLIDISLKSAESSSMGSHMKTFSGWGAGRDLQITFRILWMRIYIFGNLKSTVGTILYKLTYIQISDHCI